MIFKVDGIDLTEFVAANEYNVERNDLDGPNAGRTMDTTMHRDYLGFKRKIQIKFIPLDKEKWADIEHNILRGKEWHTVEFEDFGQIATAQMYHSSFSGTISTITGKRIGAAVNFIEE